MPEQFTVAGLLFIAVGTLAGIIARLYLNQEQAAKRHAEAYQKLALFVMQQQHLICRHDGCPKQAASLLPDEIRQIVSEANVAPHIEEQINQKEARP